jgi:hypothetical protein
MAAMLHLFAHMGITTMRRTLARLMATTGRIGSTAAYLLEPGHGSTAFVEVIGAVVASAGEVASVDVAALPVAAPSTDAAALLVADPDLPDKAGLHAAAGLRADQLVGDSAVTAVATSTVQVAADSTAVEAAGSTVEAAGSTAVVEATAAATGN